VPEPLEHDGVIVGDDDPDAHGGILSAPVQFWSLGP
jgi:hypothetical protein